MWQEDGARLRACSTPLVEGMRLLTTAPHAGHDRPRCRAASRSSVRDRPACERPRRSPRRACAPSSIDEGERAGGQIYRRPPAGFLRPPEVLYGSEAGKARRPARRVRCAGGAGSVELPSAKLGGGHCRAARLHVLGEEGIDAVPYERLILADGGERQGRSRFPAGRRRASIRSARRRSLSRPRAWHWGGGWCWPGPAPC